MGDVTLTKTRLFRGVWEGELVRQGGGAAVPEVEVTCMGEAIDGVMVDPAPGDDARFLVRIPIPAEMISDGVQTFLIADRATGELLGRFALAAGEALGSDLVADLELMRAELDMLKRAFRRHCVETG